MIFSACAIFSRRARRSPIRSANLRSLAASLFVFPIRPRSTDSGLTASGLLVRLLEKAAEVGSGGGTFSEQTTN